MALNPIYIDSATAGANISIGTTNATSLTIGNTNCATTLAGTTTSSTLKSTSIDPVTSGGNLNIGTITPSTINIGTASATAVNVGSSSITTNLNGNTNIARNTTGTNPTYIECGSSTTFNIIDFHSNSANATDYDARITCSGGTSTTGQGDLSITSKSLTISSPLTINYSTPTTSQLGGFISVPYASPATSFSSTVDKVYATYTLTQAGYYLFVVNCINYTASCANPYGQALIFDVTNSKYIAYTAQQYGTTSSTMAYSLSGFYNVPASTSTVIELRVNITFSSGTATATNGVYNFYIVRIS